MSDKTWREWVVQGLGPVTLVGVASYAAVGAANETFYDAFGLSVERVGLDASTLLTRSLVVALPLLTLYAVLVALVGLTYVILAGGPWLISREVDGRVPRLVLHAVAAVFVIGIGASLGSRRFDAVGGAMVASGFAMHCIGEDRLRRGFRSLARRYVLGALALLAFLSLVVTSWLLGAAWGRQFQEDKPLTLTTAAFILLPSWPERVTVRPVADPPELPAPAPRATPYLLLGTKDGHLVLYDTEYDEVVRLPAGDFTIQTSR